MRPSFSRVQGRTYRYGQLKAGVTINSAEARPFSDFPQMRGFTPMTPPGTLIRLREPGIKRNDMPKARRSCYGPMKGVGGRRGERTRRTAGQQHSHRASEPGTTRVLWLHPPRSRGPAWKFTRYSGHERLPVRILTDSGRIPGGKANATRKSRRRV